MNVLLVEPDVLLSKTYAHALEKIGVKTTAVRNAQKALFALEEQLSDLIILELQLANHNGIEFIYELRSYADWHKIPIMLHTLVPPHVLKPNLNMLYALGVIGYLYKPDTSLKLFAHRVAELQPAAQ